MVYSDKELRSIFLKNPKKGFDLIFKQYYESLCLTAARITKENNLAEDIVQEVFFEFYKKEDADKIESLIGYLKRSVYNRALNKIKATRATVDSDGLNVQINETSNNSQEQLEYKELEDFINEIIDTLPEKCRLVFVLNRFEQLSYKEVAEKLDISVKTVENQMSKALKILRNAYADYKSYLENEQTG